MDITWGVSNALNDLGVSDKSEDDGGTIGTEYVTHGNPHAEDEEGPIGFEEQVYPEQKTGRELPVSCMSIHFCLIYILTRRRPLEPTSALA